MNELSVNDGETGVMVKMQGIEKVDEYKYLWSARQKAMGDLQKRWRTECRQRGGVGGDKYLR